MARPRIFLDSNVILDVTVRGNKPAQALWKALEQGTLEATVIAPILTETYYIAYEISKKESKALEIISELVAMNNIECVDLNDVVAQKAGELCVKYNYLKGLKRPWEECLSITDSFLLAASACTKGSRVCSTETKFKFVSEASTLTPAEFMSGK